MSRLALGWFWSGIVTVAVTRGLLKPLPAPVAAARFPGSQRITALARLATWSDVGAGLGPFVAGLVLSSASTSVIHAVCAIALLAAAWLNVSHFDVLPHRVHPRASSD